MDKTGEHVKANKKAELGDLLEKEQCQGHRSRDEFKGWP